MPSPPSPGSPPAGPAAGPTAGPAAPGRSPLTTVGLTLCALAGLVGPWVFNLRWFAAGGSVLPEAFFGAATANALTTAITLDVYVAAVAFSVWVLAERRVRWPWAYVAGCFAIGLAFALPLYLLRRREAASPDTA